MAEQKEEMKQMLNTLNNTVCSDSSHPDYYLCDIIQGKGYFLSRLKSLSDWLTVTQSVFDWLSSPSGLHKYENPSQKSINPKKESILDYQETDSISK